MTAAESSCYTLINYPIENESVTEAKLKEDLGEEIWPKAKNKYYFIYIYPIFLLKCNKMCILKIAPNQYD